MGCFFHCRKIGSNYLLSLFAPSMYHVSVTPCACIWVPSWHRYADSEDLAEKLFGDIRFCHAIIKRTPICTKRRSALICFLSIIQTGFVETLKPQFVPGQVMAGSTATANLVEEKLSHLQLAQENDNLKSQVSQSISSDKRIFFLNLFYGSAVLLYSNCLLELCAHTYNT